MTIKRQLRLRDSTVLGDDDAVPPKPLDRGGREGDPPLFLLPSPSSPEPTGGDSDEGDRGCIGCSSRCIQSQSSGSTMRATGQQ